jgi:CBS domain-containing protein/anti-sigma regulatory factor (Ser/Thr protein kinase)
MDDRRLGGGVIPTERVITDEMAGHITRVEELFYELRIRDVMTRDPKVVTPDVQMGTVLELLRQSRTSGAPVVSDGELVGIISIEDLIRALTWGALEAPLADYMTTKVITVEAGQPVVEALKLFASARVGRLPVVDNNGKLVGIITKGDITRGVLTALQQDYQAEEIRRYRASHLFEDIVSDRTSLVLRYYIKGGDFAQGGQASHHIKRALLRLGATPQIARRCGIAIYEAEMNIIIHTIKGGIIRIGIEPTDILMETIDEGPGIPDIQLAMTPGYSTATEEVRELGFGAGMGLKNIERCTDSMHLESSPATGTHLTMRIRLQPHESRPQDTASQRAEEAP